MDECRIMVIGANNIYGKLLSEVVRDISGITGINENMATSQLHDFFVWSAEHIKKENRELALDTGIFQNFSCPTYDLPGYSVLPLHIMEDVFRCLVND